jgi:hypothetical protein
MVPASVVRCNGAFEGLGSALMPGAFAIVIEQGDPMVPCS